MGKKNDRLHKLTEILRIRSFVPIKELAELLGVSEMTIRRDIKLLEQTRMVENVYGTGVFRPGQAAPPEDYDLLREVRRQDLQKEAIGRAAAALVEPGDIVILDTGTTTEQIVPLLPGNRDITVLCYNINILMELRRNTGVRIVLAGGYYHPNTQMFESAQGVDFIRSIRAQKVFLSAAGVHERLGVTCMNSYEVPTKRAALQSSLQKILVADSSKFGRVRPAYFCELSDLSAVVTDSGLSAQWRERIESLGLRLVLADAEL